MPVATRAAKAGASGGMDADATGSARRARDRQARCRPQAAGWTRARRGRRRVESSRRPAGHSPRARGASGATVHRGCALPHRNRIVPGHRPGCPVIQKPGACARPATTDADLAWLTASPARARAPPGYPRSPPDEPCESSVDLAGTLCRDRRTERPGQAEGRIPGRLAPARLRDRARADSRPAVPRRLRAGEHERGDARVEYDLVGLGEFLLRLAAPPPRRLEQTGVTGRRDRRGRGERGGGLRSAGARDRHHLGRACGQRLGRPVPPGAGPPWRGLPRGRAAAEQPDGPVLRRVRGGAAAGAGDLRPAGFGLRPSGAGGGGLVARPRGAAPAPDGDHAGTRREPARCGPNRLARGGGGRGAGLVRRQLPVAALEPGRGARVPGRRAARRPGTSSSGPTMRGRCSGSPASPRRCSTASGSWPRAPRSR